ncbi:hypothetical protein C3L33_22218, partial [Rhododendron williamsianum]
MSPSSNGSDSLFLLRLLIPNRVLISSIPISSSVSGVNLKVIDVFLVLFGLEMAEVTKLLYIVVVEDDEEERREKGKESFRYTRPVLQSTLQLMGCKARHAFKISQRVFELMKSKCSAEAWVSTEVEISELDCAKGQSQKENNCFSNGFSDKADGVHHLGLEKDAKSKSKPFESYKRRTTMVVRRKTFLDVVCDALAEYKYVGPNQRADLVLACRFRERKESVTVLLCGTSGCGKSTLSALLGSRLGITTVISTDSIRHMMRSFVDEKQNPLLWASTYHAGEHLDLEAVAAAKAKRKATKLAGVSQLLSKDDVSDGPAVVLPEVDSTSVELISPKQMALRDLRHRVKWSLTVWIALSLHGKNGKNQQGSTRHLMALLNTDGSVAKAWPVNSIDCNGKRNLDESTENGIGTPMYGPLQIGKSEPVNLQFGHFGISSWPNDTGGTSHASSVDESRGDLTDNGSKYYSSCCSSPRMSDGPAKELKEEQSVHGSDEEVDDPPEVDSDEDLSDDGRKQQFHEEMEGSVDEESTKSDEEYDDLAMQDIQENGYLSDDDEFKDKVVPMSGKEPTSDVLGVPGDKDGLNLDVFSRTKSEPFSELPCSYSSVPRDKKNEKRVPSSGGNVKLRKRSQSIPAFGKRGS